MSKKKIPKGLGEEKVEKKELNEIFQLEIGLVTVLVIIGIFSVISGLTEVMPTMAGQASELCKESDGGINVKEKGIINGMSGNKYVTKEDKCKSDTAVWEYYCNLNNCPLCISSEEISCPKGTSCSDGVCS